MSTRLTRREFVQGTTAALLAGGAGVPLMRPRPTRAAQGGAEAWSFGLLGDLHYDLWEHHDMDWVKSEKPNDIRQIEGYVRVTTEILPHLGAELRAVIADTPGPVDYVINIGDFVEGLCGSYELQVKQFEDALEWVRQSRWDARFLITKGNHDITGPGARQAYDDTMLPFLGGQIDQQLDTSNFLVEHRNAVFAFVDAYHPREIVPWLEQALAGRSAQHVFVVIHPPVVPYHARANWTVFGRDGQQEQRREFLNVLGKHHAIVLSGHLHRYGFARRRTETGHFIELAINSVVRSAEHEPREVWQGVERYGPEIVTLEPRFSPDTEQERRDILTAEKPFIEHFACGTVEGYGMIRVDGEHVKADVYKGLGRRLWQTLDLTAVLTARGSTPYDVTDFLC